MPPTGTCTTNLCCPASFKPQPDFATLAFQGTLKDGVVCLVCKTSRFRTDKFMDLSLVIRPFGSTELNTSVHSALDYFVRPEVMSEGNQVTCDTCGKKADAMKGICLAELPSILMLQLKRFDFDMETLRRVKLNDRVSLLFLGRVPVHPSQ